ncbi:MAG: gliding motility protein GldL [Bacteroidales bacterium]|nr:gliding motility protein GldL [Bacteroidales bacterium]
MGLDAIVRSKGYKNFMSKLYGIGASLVILGALFKILHLPGANIMLMVGMGTEAIIFFFSAFEPLHVEYNWALVYPELAMGEDVQDVVSDKKRKPTGLTVTQELDNMLSEAKIGPELIESLAKGMKNLGENASKLSGVADAAVATDSYVSNLTKASESVRTLVSVYDKTSDAMSKDMNVSENYLNNVTKAANAVGQLASIYEQTVQTIQTDNSSYNAELQKLSKNLSAINAAYEIQLQNTQQHVDATNDIQQNIKKFTTNLNESVENTVKYKEQIDNLTKNVSMLNTVYGNMLSAMNVNR